MSQANIPAEVCCDGRERMTQAAANAVVRRATWKAHAYRCQHCGNWHVGTAKPKGGHQSTKGRRR